MTEPITFEDARKIARAYLSLADHMVVTGHPSGEALWDGPVTSAGPMGSELAMVASLKPDLLPSLLPEYIKLAHQDREWWDALCVFAGRLLRNNVPLADDLRLFIADVLTDDRRRLLCCISTPIWSLPSLRKFQLAPVQPRRLPALRVHPVRDHVHVRLPVPVRHDQRLVPLHP